MHDFFIQQLDSAKEQVVQFGGEQGSSDVINVVDSFERHYAAARTAIQPFFKKQGDDSYQTQQAIQVIKQQEQGAYSITALACAALQCLGFTTGDEDIILPVAVASLLSDISSNEDVEYHNGLHFMRVVTHSIRLISTHNFLEQPKLDKSETTKLIIAACIHDLGHDGTGNIVDGIYHMARTELESFNLAKPFLEKSGLSKSDLDDIKVMLFTTDVTMFPEVTSPLDYLQAAYTLHLSGKKSDIEFIPMLSALENRKDLCLLSMLLHEADIMNSAGVSYEITREESIKVSQEVGRHDSLPEHTMMFLEKICHGSFLTNAAKHLGNKNLKSIMRQVSEDHENGNASYF